MVDPITDTPVEEVIEPEVPEPETPEEPEAPVVEPEPEVHEPPVRKTPKDFIIERKDRKIAKLEGEIEEEPEGSSDTRAVIREELAPLTQMFTKSKDEEELQSVLTKYPDAKKLEKQVRMYMENDAYSRVPVEFIVRGLLGAREAIKTKADTEARGSRQGGHTRRPTEVKAKSAWDMTQAEFDKSVSDLMSGKTQ